jgi:hypothetical protein
MPAVCDRSLPTDRKETPVNQVAYRPLEPHEWAACRHDIPTGRLPFFERTTHPDGTVTERFGFGPPAHVRELLDRREAPRCG